LTSCVELLGDRDEGDAVAVEQLDDLGEIHLRPGQTVARFVEAFFQQMDQCASRLIVRNGVKSISARRSPDGRFAAASQYISRAPGRTPENPCRERAPRSNLDRLPQPVRAETR
jgi:hypothetical protein